MPDSTPLDDTWNSRDLPVLREVVRTLDDANGRPVSIRTVAGNLGMPGDAVQRATIALKSDGLIATIGDFDLPDSDFTSVTGTARRLAGSWPSPESALERMVVALNELAENGRDEDTRSRARKAIDAMVRGGSTVGYAVAAAVITGQLPGQ